MRKTHNNNLMNVQFILIISLIAFRSVLLFRLLFKENIEQQGGKAIALAADVASETDVVNLFNTIDRQLGTVTALVNNAGILEQQMRVENIDASRLHRIFATNIIGSFLCVREAIKRMSTKHGGAGGAIVNVSSVASRLGSQ